MEASRARWLGVAIGCAGALGTTCCAAGVFLLVLGDDESRLDTGNEVAGSGICSGTPVPGAGPPSGAPRWVALLASDETYAPYSPAFTPSDSPTSIGELSHVLCVSGPELGASGPTGCAQTTFHVALREAASGRLVAEAPFRERSASCPGEYDVYPDPTSLGAWVTANAH